MIALDRIGRRRRTRGVTPQGQIPRSVGRGNVRAINGRLYVDGEAIAFRSRDALARPLIESVSGRVLELGLGFGVYRAFLAANPWVTDLETIEQDADIIRLWRNTPEVTEDLFVPSAETPSQRVTRGSARGKLASAAARGATYDAIVIDTPGVWEQSRSRDNIRSLLTVGKRVVISSMDEPTEPGFAWQRLAQLDDDEGLWFGDRWEPAAGIGTTRKTFVPGKGRI